MRNVPHMARQAVRETAGSALATALVLVSVALVLTGVALAAFLVQYKMMRQDAHHAQAQYIAEAGLFSVIDGLQENPGWRPVDSLLALPDETESRVDVTPFGGYLRVRARATFGRSQYTSRALVGQVPTPWFSHALVVWDRAQAGMHLNGQTTLTGDLAIVAPEGRALDTLNAIIDGEGFSGTVAGSVGRYDSLDVDFRPDVFTETLAWCDQLLAGTPPEHPPEQPVYTYPGHARFTAADAELFSVPVTLVAAGRLAVEGPLALQPGTVLIAGDTLHIDGPVTCRHGLFYGRAGVVVTGTARCGGQWLSRGHIGVQDAAYLTYPSMLYLTGEGAAVGGRIALTGQAHVDGMVVHLQTEPDAAQARRFRRGRVVIDPQARLRGAVYNGQETELHGRLHGTLLTNRTYFYYQSARTPGTHKENWLRHATLTRPGLPADFTAPLWFGTHPKLRIVAWDGHPEPRPPPG